MAGSKYAGSVFFVFLPFLKGNLRYTSEKSEETQQRHHFHVFGYSIICRFNHLTLAECNNFYEKERS